MAPGKEPALRELEDTWRAVGQQTQAHVAERGWTKTAFEVFNNQKPRSNNTSPWSLEEPVAATDYQALRYLFTLAKWSFDGAAAKNIRVITRVDIGHWECGRMRTVDGRPTVCYKAKAFNSARAAETLRPVVGRWVVGPVHLHGASVSRGASSIKLATRIPPCRKGTERSTAEKLWVSPVCSPAAA